MSLTPAFLSRRPALVAAAVLTLACAHPLAAQAPRTAADSMLAMIRSRAGIVDTPAKPAPATRPVATTARRPAAAPVSAPKPVVIHDTVVVRDTVLVPHMMRDTITVRETVTIRDTVVVHDTVVVRDAVLRPAPAVAAPTAAPAAPKPAPAAPSAPAAPAARMAEVGFGTLKFDGLLQMHFGATNSAAASSFRIRRAEIKVSGRISPLVGWAMMFDVSKPLSLSTQTANVSGSNVVTSTSVNQNSRLMQDAILTVDFKPTIHVDAGQFRLPLGNVGSGSSANLETIERPMFQSDRARGGALGDVRDIGFVVRGTAYKVADYWVGAFNGTGESQNTTDVNNEKAVVGRVTFKTPVDGLRIGASGLYTGFEAGMPTRKDRYGAEVTYQHGKYLGRIEAQHGIDGVTDRAGGFALFGYRLLPQLQLVTRVDAWDPDVRRDDTAATVRATDYLAGATWLLAGDNAKLQVNLSRRSYAGGVSPTVNTLLFNLQASW